MDQVESEDIVYTLETITEKFGEEIAPYALGMTTNLAQAYWKCVKKRKRERTRRTRTKALGTRITTTIFKPCNRADVCALYRPY